MWQVFELIDGALCKMWRICKSNQRFQTLSFSPSTLIVFENLHFQWRFQRFTVDGRRKRIEKYVFKWKRISMVGPKAFWGTHGETWRRQEVRQIEHSSLWQCISHHCLKRLTLASVLGPFGVYLLTFNLPGALTHYEWGHWNFRLFVSYNNNNNNNFI